MSVVRSDPPDSVITAPPSTEKKMRSRFPARPCGAVREGKESEEADPDECGETRVHVDRATPNRRGEQEEDRDQRAESDSHASDEPIERRNTRQYKALEGSIEHQGEEHAEDGDDHSAECDGDRIGSEDEREDRCRHG